MSNVTTKSINQTNLQILKVYQLKLYEYPNRNLIVVGEYAPVVTKGETLFITTVTIRNTHNDMQSCIYL